jgi:superfamily II DNA/RNA helicase
MNQTRSRRPRTGRRNTNTSSRHQSGRRSFSSNRGPRRQARKQPTFDPTQFINKNPVEIKEEVYVPKHAFADFKIDGRIKEVLKVNGIEIPSPIQDQTIPAILEGKDVVGLAETGTGKTAAFLIPLIEQKKDNMKAATLILTPTRELALQIEQEFRKLSKQFRMFSVVCVGGTSIRPQLRMLKKRNQFIIGTPGRVKDLLERGEIRTEAIDSVVLDEADRMLDMGFINDMRDILSQLPEKRQTLCFSATMDDRTAGLVNDFMREPITVSVKKKDVTDSIAQDVIPFQHSHKFETLIELLAQDSFRRVIIFGAMKHSVEKLSRELTQAGIKAESIHGNKNHNQRQNALRRFKSGQARVLVATDVAARGIHVDNVSHVINYDLPQTFEDYVHRIGRTGRGVESGQALTFVPAS